MNTADLFDMAKEELLHIDVNEEFSLRDLFKGYEWNRIKHGERIKLGTSFQLYILSQGNFKVLDDNRGQRRYVRIS